MDPNFLDHQLHRLRRSPPAAPDGIEGEVWRRIRNATRETRTPFPFLDAGLFRSGLALAASLGFLLPWSFVSPSGSPTGLAGFDQRVFSIEAPGLPSARLAKDGAR